MKTFSEHVFTLAATDAPLVTPHADMVSLHFTDWTNGTSFRVDFYQAHVTELRTLIAALEAIAVRPAPSAALSAMATFQSSEEFSRRVTFADQRAAAGVSGDAIMSSPPSPRPVADRLCRTCDATFTGSTYPDCAPAEAECR